MDAFVENDYQDVGTISFALSGATNVRGGSKLYRTVALDVLGYMTGQGLLKRD